MKRGHKEWQCPQIGRDEGGRLVHKKKFTLTVALDHAFMVTGMGEECVGPSTTCSVNGLEKMCMVSSQCFNYLRETEVE